MGRAKEGGGEGEVEEGGRERVREGGWEGGRERLGSFKPLWGSFGSSRSSNKD